MRTLLRNLAILATICTGISAHAQSVTTPPAELCLPPFYKKHMNVNGIHICSSDKVPDSCFHAARITFDALTRMLPSHVMESLTKRGARVTIMAKDEMTTDVPEHAYLARDKKTDWDKRARGLGGTLWLPLSSCAE